MVWTAIAARQEKPNSTKPGHRRRSRCCPALLCHLAVAIEDRALLQKQARRLDVALQAPPWSDHYSVGGSDLPFQAPRDEEPCDLDVGLDEAALSHVEFSLRDHPPGDVSLHAKGIAEPKVTVEFAPGVQETIELSPTAAHAGSLAIKRS